MQNTYDEAIKKLLDLESRADAMEAQAQRMKKDCLLTRQLLEAGVSTQAKKSINNKAIASMVADRELQIKRKTRQL